VRSTVTGYVLLAAVVLAIGIPITWKLARQTEANHEIEARNSAAAKSTIVAPAPAEPVSRVTTTGAFVPVAGLLSAPVVFQSGSAPAATTAAASLPTRSIAKPAARATRPHRAASDDDNPYDDHPTTPRSSAARPSPAASAPSDPFVPRE
jgi:hypothetical protein